MSERSETPAARHSHVEVVQTVADALLAVAVWLVLAIALAVPLTYVVGLWPLLLVLPTGVLGAALNLRARAVTLRDRSRRGQPVPD